MCEQMQAAVFREECVLWYSPMKEELSQRRFNNTLMYCSMFTLCPVPYEFFTADRQRLENARVLF